MPPILQTLLDQFIALPVTTADLRGKTVMVVGANRGIGFEIALHLARMKPSSLILACRDVAKGRSACASISEFTCMQNVDSWPLELESFDSVRAFVQDFKREGNKKLDLLVVSSVILTMKYGCTTDGWEKRQDILLTILYTHTEISFRSLQVNYLSPVLLTILLLPFLSLGSLNSKSSRVVFVTSEAHMSITSDPMGWGSSGNIERSNMIQTLNTEAVCNRFPYMIQRYSLTKLFGILFTKHATTHFGQNSPTVFATCNPGFCRTDILQQWKANLVGDCLISLITALFARTAEKGSRNILFAAFAESDDTMAGAYVTSCRIGEPGAFVRSESSNELEERLWHETIEYLATIDPAVLEVVNEGAAYIRM